MMTKKVAPFVKGRLTNSLTQIDYWEVCCMTHFPFFFGPNQSMRIAPLALDPQIGKDSEPNGASSTMTM